MKRIIAATLAAALASTAVIADTLPVNSGRPPIQLPTGAEVDGATDYTIEPGGTTKQITGIDKIRADMLASTIKSTSE